MGSLFKYNKEVTQAQLYQFFRKSFGVELIPGEGSDALNQILAQDVALPLWLRAAEIQHDDMFVSQASMQEAMNEMFPHVTLNNADVILLPGSLRLIVSEPLQDFFRDTGLHWLAIGAAIDAATPEERAKLRNLDPYAADILSEFVSVMGVALVQLVAQKNFNLEVGSQMLWIAFRRIADSTDAEANRGRAPKIRAKFFEEQKRELIASVERPPFVDITDSAHLDFHHKLDLVLRENKGALLTFGIAGSGVSATDFDGDGYTDLFFAGVGARLYRNVRGQRFEDVTEEAGLSGFERESRAGYFIDFDDDGDQDPHPRA